MKVVTVVLFALISTAIGGCWWWDSEMTDAEMIAYVESLGVDVNSPQDLDFYLYFPDKASATKACDTLKQEGYKVEVEQWDSEDRTITCTAARKLVPELGAIQKISSYMEDLASKHRGSYAEWSIKLDIVVE